MTLTKHNGTAKLIDPDGGVGLPHSAEPKREGFGLSLVDILTERIGGSYTVSSANGTEYVSSNIVHRSERWHTLLGSERDVAQLQEAAAPVSKCE